MAVAALTTMFVMAAGATATGLSSGNGGGNSGPSLHAFVQSSVLSQAQQSPDTVMDVVVQGEKKGNANGLYKKLVGDGTDPGSIKEQFKSVAGVHAMLSGKQIMQLAKRSYVDSITANDTVKMAGVQLPAYNTQLWAYATGAVVDWTNASLPKLPTIAVVDSGIQPGRADFGSRVLGQVNMASLTPNLQGGDGYGHGTFVAGIAAGSAPGYAGIAPKANILSLDVMNDQGQASVADVIRACDWILQNKSTYNIRVANFSLHAVNRASVLFDPLDQAVEKLWLNGVVVVAASGNYAVDGQQSDVQFAPGNDPFVITVGAADIGTKLGSNDDMNAPFSAWGYTPDGFAKPEISAPGRYIIGPTPANGTLALERPENVTAPGYMKLSGTSFASPMVAGAAAMLLNNHPTWTPDQVKGALMMTATPQLLAPKGSLGVGELNIPRARAIKPTQALPNPNAGLNQFLSSASDGSKVFNAVAWESAAKSNVAWDSAAWSDAAWSDAAWSSVAWSDAAWADVAWATAAWGTVAWSDAAWSDAAWSDAAWADNADGDDLDPALASSDIADSVMADLGIVDPNCDPTLSLCSTLSSTTSTISSTVGGLLP